MWVRRVGTLFRVWRVLVVVFPVWVPLLLTRRLAFSIGRRRGWLLCSGRLVCLRRRLWLNSRRRLMVLIRTM